MVKMRKRKIDSNQGVLIPVIKKKKEKIWIPKTKKKKKWSGYKPTIQGRPQSRDYLQFLNPDWCHYCLNSENAMTLGLNDDIMKFRKKSKYYRKDNQLTHWCQSWYLCHVTGKIVRFHDTCPKFKGRELESNENTEKKEYHGPDIEETITYTEEILEICKHYNNRSCTFLNIKVESGTCIGCESR